METTVTTREANDALKQKKEHLNRKESREGNDVHLISLRHRFFEIIILVTSGILCATAFPGTNFSFTAWFSIIPLFAIARNKTPERAWRCGYYWGFGWAIVSFFWIREIELILPLPLAAYLALFPAFWAYAIPFMQRQIYVPNEIQLKGFQAEQLHERTGKKKELLFITTLAAWWCILEWVRSWLFTGLPWNNLATTQWQNLSFIQICEYTGIYGVSFIIVFTNLAIFHSYLSWKNGLATGRYKRSISFVVAMLMLLLNFLVGSKAIVRANNPDGRIPFTASVIQGNIPQSRAATLEQVTYSLGQHKKLTEKALDKAELNAMQILNDLKETGRTSSFQESSLLKGKPDIVIWSETAVPIPYTFKHSLGHQYRQIVQNIIKKYKTPFLLGTLDYKSGTEGEIAYNSAFLIDTDGNIADKYHKKHIVPFGEFVPFADMFPWLVDMIGMGRGLSRGTRTDPLTLKKNIHAGTSICFEDVFPYITRDQARSGANMLLTVTNDAWYPLSDEPEQHLANSVFRAIETRLPFIRCGNNSGSCVISETGQITDSVSKKFDVKQQLFLPDPATKEEGFATFSIAVQKSPHATFYTRNGDLFIHVCLSLIFVVAAFCAAKWRAKKEILLKAFDNAE